MSKGGLASGDQMMIARPLGLGYPPYINATRLFTVHFNINPLPSKSIFFFFDFQKSKRVIQRKRGSKDGKKKGVKRSDTERATTHVVALRTIQTLKILCPFEVNEEQWHLKCSSFASTKEQEVGY